MRVSRLFRILGVASRYGIPQMLADADPTGSVNRWLGWWIQRRKFNESRAVRLRLALESLGPIFVKFGQMLSTRRDLLPLDLADELAQLQDRVPPFPLEQVQARITQEFGCAPDDVFREFEPEPVASASVAQVHFAVLPDGTEVAVKVLRPGIDKIITHDLELLDVLASLGERLWSDGKRLKLREVVAEFKKHLNDELDLMREAANCSQLRRNFTDSALLQVPGVYWDYCRNGVMVMERMHGIPISQTERLLEAGVDLKALSRAGVEIFFTQVFRDGFFHADMHPCNIFVATDAANFGKYISLDFGIMGTLTDVDKNYLAQNFLAFFRHDYKRVAQAHIDAGWAPSDTRVDEFEAAIRAVCEPIFDKPLKDISFGRVLLRLFQTSRRFNVEIQPQLVLLQKTLLNIEGLGRQLDPELDLWKTAKPFLERWMSEQVGWRSLVKNLLQEAPGWTQTLPQLPRVLYQALAGGKAQDLSDAARQLAARQRRQEILLWLAIALGAGACVLEGLRYL